MIKSFISSKLGNTVLVEYNLEKNWLESVKRNGQEFHIDTSDTVMLLAEAANTFKEDDFYLQ